jgi:hypothetical protein
VAGFYRWILCLKPDFILRIVNPSMLAIIELSGETGAGKSTIANLLGEELAPAGLLFIDASPDQRLTLMLAPEPPELTLGNLFSRRQDATGSREAIDWAFTDLTVPAGEENDLLTVGALDAEIGPVEREKLRYGLNRLIAHYDYVVIDGLHPVIHALLPEESTHTLTLLTPSHLAQWLPPETATQTPALLLNRYNQEPYTPVLEEALHQGRVQLIGKLPRYATSEDCIRQMPDDFRNCLLRMNIPLKSV